MLQNGHDVYLSVQAAHAVDPGNSNSWRTLDLGCHLHYQLVPPSARDGYSLARRTENWCSSTPSGIKVLIVTDLDHDFGRDQIPLVKWICPSVTTAIHLPYDDLQESEWLSMLTPQEWQAWATPTIELAIITHDRPWSLTRLLDSVSRAHYFGDRVNVAINLEQTADADTRRIAEGFTMGPAEGRVSVRHRIVHAGLMAAVVESWHPHGNHSYGVILEDDVELSPMFYAWVKFCVLRYRYGAHAEQSSQLYGVSLYQPKVTELRMEGRRPFDARAIFAQLKLEYPHTPYLSQVPCSWGAVYFPEHWREFQQYLALRLSEHTMPVDDIVVPDLRSNKWSRSWKKFFNEMVFLRGYVSLYPNYEYFVSLSTNHLEVGEHVPPNVNQEKQRQYFLPLMQSQQQRQKAATAAGDVKLLDLPLSNLPPWSALPVLDLWGRTSSLNELKSMGLVRRANMSVCAVDELHADALEFLCPIDGASRGSSEIRETYRLSFVDDDGPDLMQG
ncbi:hypothetical protein BDV93DRAFT_441738 [Ceratobasidium sp. AG-I]|nr:hypothetical protein BDV93DRAFT_441738 [Ceratobasidium sp. AG-I]